MVCHTSITHSEIPYLTIPQINNYRKGIGKNAPIKMGLFGMLGGMPSEQGEKSPEHKEPCQEDVDSFFNGF